MLTKLMLFSKWENNHYMRLLWICVINILHLDYPAICDIIRARRMGLAGHCVRHPELVASNLILWEPKHGIRSRGRPATTYIDTLRRDIGLSNTGEIRALMINSDLWRAAIRDSRVGVG